MSEQTFEAQSFLQLKATATLRAEDGSSQPAKKSRAPKPEKEPKTKREKRVAGASAEETYKLYQQGMQPAEIAHERGLAESTIWGHLGTVVQSGRLHIEDLIDPVDLMEIEDAVESMTGAYTFQDLRDAIDDHIPNGAIRLYQISKR
ncbi:MAG: helix-turn-helix domain-containing protein [Bacteroidales bacterium]|nr:helix-turn-helix domain-containing protein [Bacteroidales bacterium]